MELEDLIVLRYGSNSAVTNVVDAKDVEDENLSIDLERGTWSYEAPSHASPVKDREIGGRARIPSWGAHHGVIGVYDRRETSQLSTMVYVSRQATSEPRVYYD